MILSDEEMSEITNTLITVNTPLSFYKWLENFPGVRRVSNTFNEEQLLDMFNELAAGGFETEDNLAISYAILVAIIISRRRKKGMLGKNPIPKDVLSWSENMWSYAERNCIASSVISIDSCPQNPIIIDLTNKNPNHQMNPNTGILIVR